MHGKLIRLESAYQRKRYELDRPSLNSFPLSYSSLTCYPGMDILYRRMFWDSLRCLSKGRSIVLITHMMEEADYLCDRLAIMVEGTIICSGAALSLKTRSVTNYRNFSGLNTEDAFAQRRLSATASTGIMCSGRL